MNEATATAATVAPQAVSTPKNAWLTLATLADLNAYMKSIKVGGIKAASMRDRWATANGVTLNGSGPVVIKEEVTEGEVKPMSEHFDDETVDARKALEEKQDAAPVAEAGDGGKKPPKAKPVAAAAAPAPGGMVTRYIDPTMIDVREGWNARVDFGDLEELATSILAQKKLDGHGIINDLRVREKADGRYELVDGERRWQTVMGLIDEGHVWEFGIPSKVEPAEATDRDLIIKMFTANQGKPFLPYEEAMYYKRLQDSGMTLREIEEKTGRSDNSIVGALALLQADDDLVEAVIKGTVGATMAKSIAVNARGDKAKQKELTAKAKDAKKSGNKKALQAVKKDIDDARRAKAAKQKPNLKLKAKKADDAEIASLGQEVAARLKETMEMLGLDFDTNMEEWIANDRELQIAANFGALAALKRIMGVAAQKVTF